MTLDESTASTSSATRATIETRMVARRQRRSGRVGVCVCMCVCSNESRRSSSTVVEGVDVPSVKVIGRSHARSGQHLVRHPKISVARSYPSSPAFSADCWLSLLLAFARLEPLWLSKLESKHHKSLY